MLLTLVAVFALSVCVVSGQEDEVQCFDETVNSDYKCDWKHPKFYDCCIIHGDPHILSFDNVKYRFGGDCDYVLTEFCDPVEDGDLRITSDFESVTAEQFRAESVCIRVKELTVYIRWDGFFTTKANNANNEIGMDSFDQITPGDANIKVIGFTDDGITDCPVYIILIQDCSDPNNPKTLVRVQYEHKYHRIKIYVQRALYLGKICGLCGLFDDDGENDISSQNKPMSAGMGGRRRKRMTPDTASIKKFGDRWAVEDTCQSGGMSGSNPDPDGK